MSVNGIVRQARIALGGVATVPWRSLEAEKAILDKVSRVQRSSALSDHSRTDNSGHAVDRRSQESEGKVGRRAHEALSG
jgi:CO/xanthine dehydrogenase FAD-binding subunit